MTRTTPNGTTVAEDTFVLGGLRARRSSHTGGPFVASEFVWLYTIDGKRVVAYWTQHDGGRASGSVCHYRDTGEDFLGDVELEELVAAAQSAWPAYAIAGTRKPSTSQVNA